MGALDGDIDIPKVGKLPKKALIPILGAAAAYVGWRFWRSRGAATDTAASTISDGEFGAVDSSVPDTLNPFPGSFSGGGGGGGAGTPATGDRNNDGVIGPGEFTTNGEWTDFVVTKLQQSDTWSYTDIITALGNGLAGKPTTDTQQAILRAAIAVGGQPPTGAITYVAGGNTDLNVAPGTPSVSVTETTATVSFSGVPGAASYQVFRSGVGSAYGTGTGSPIEIGGLTPNTPYSVQVAGVTSSGKVGPKSGSASFRTKTYTIGKPGAPSISNITASSATATISAVPNADEYIWYLNGSQHALSEGMVYPFTGLKSKTKYTVGVTARGFHQLASPMSPVVTFTTK